MNKRVLELLTLSSGAVFAGMVISHVILNQTATGDDSGPQSIVIAKIVLGALLSKWSMAAAFIFFAMFFLYLKQNDFDFNISVNPRKAMNFLVYLYIATFFFIPIPGAILSFALLFLCFATPLRNRIQANMRPFWLVFWCFLVLEISGLVSAWLDINEIRKFIPFTRQVLTMVSFLNAFIVYYVIKRNNWGFKEFETFFKVFMYCIVVIALESVLTFYLGIGRGISIFGYPSLYRGTMFQSTLVGSYHTVGRLGMTLVFISIYFFFKYRKKKYCFFPVLGFLLIFSTLNRQVILATIVGFLLLLFLLKRNKKQAKSPASNVLKFFSSLIILVVLAFVAINLTEQAITMRDAGGSVLNIIKRSIRWARGVDIFIYNFPFGAGSGLITYYMGSSLIPWNVSGWYSQLFGFDFSAMHLLIVGPDQVKDLPGIEGGLTIHNLWVRTIVEFGLLGLFFVVYLWRKGFKIFAHLYRLTRKVGGNIDVSSLWAVFMLVFSISLSVFMTVKFRNYWYFALLFAFLELNYRHAMLKFKQLTDNSKANIPYADPIF